MLYGYVKEDVMPMVEVEVFTIKDTTKTLPFYTLSFYKAAKLVMKDMKELYRRHLYVEHASFQSFVVVKFQAAQGPSMSVMALILDNMHLFDYDPRENRKYWEEKATVRHRLPITRVEKSLLVDDEGMRKVRDVISATDEEHKRVPNPPSGEQAGRERSK